MGDKQLLTAVEIARRLQVKPHTIKEWTRRGLIPSLKITNKILRYDLQAVISAIESKHTKEGSQ